MKLKFSNLYDVHSPDFVDIFTLEDTNFNNTPGVIVRFNVHGSPYYTAIHLNSILIQQKREVSQTELTTN